MRTPLARASVAKLKRGRRTTVAVAVTFPTVDRARPVPDRRLRRRGEEGQGAQRDQQLPHALAGARGRRRGRRRCPPAPGASGARGRRDRDADADRHGDADGDRDATPTPTATPTPAGEVPPEDLPPLIPSFADTARAAVRRPGRRAGAIAAERARRSSAAARSSATASRWPACACAVHDHPELGSTTTAADGTFELAVNGGAQITLEYTRAGYLEVQRDIDPTQLDWTNPPDVVMLDADPAGVVLDPPGRRRLDGGARRRAQTDGDGTRTSTLLFAPGTTATMRFADGTHAAAARPVDGAPDRVHVGRPGRDARRPARHVGLHVRRRARRSTRPRRPARTRSCSRRRARPRRRRSTTSRTSSAPRSAPTSRPAPTTAPTRRGSRHRTAAS